LRPEQYGASPSTARLLWPEQSRPASVPTRSRAAAVRAASFPRHQANTLALEHAQRDARNLSSNVRAMVTRGVLAMRFGGRKRMAAAAAVCSLGGLAMPTSEAASTRSCAPVLNPYPGTRYEGEDLRRIRATGVPCRRARRVARGAHRKALGLTPPSSGVRRFRWRGWHVRGDLRGASDRYVARRGENRVRWVF
jgi:hypothetical protein